MVSKDGVEGREKLGVWETAYVLSLSAVLGISRYRQLYRGWINNKVLLYSTGNYIQYPVINHNGKEYEK